MFNQSTFDQSTSDIDIVPEDESAAFGDDETLIPPSGLREAFQRQGPIGLNVAADLLLTDSEPQPLPVQPLSKESADSEAASILIEQPPPVDTGEAVVTTDIPDDTLDTSSKTTIPVRNPAIQESSFESVVETQHVGAQSVEAKDVGAKDVEVKDIGSQGVEAQAVNGNAGFLLPAETVANKEEPNPFGSTATNGQQTSVPSAGQVEAVVQGRGLARSQTASASEPSGDPAVPPASIDAAVASTQTSSPRGEADQGAATAARATSSSIVGNAGTQALQFTTTTDNLTVSENTTTIDNTTNTTVSDNTTISGNVTAHTQPGQESAQLQRTEGRPEVNPTELADRVSNAVRLSHQNGRQLRIRLHPPELGALQIEVSVRDGVLTARLEVQTPSTRQVILENMSLLRDALSQNGMAVERISVQLAHENWNDDGQSESTHHQEQESESEQPSEQQHGQSEQPTEEQEPEPQMVRSGLHIEQLDIQI